MSNEITNRERILNTFSHKPIDKIVFSPRLYYWYRGNKLWKRPRTDKNCVGKIPKHILKKDLLQIYDYLKASPRYVIEDFFLPLIWPRKKIRYVRVRWAFDERDRTIITVYKTRIGKLFKKTRGGHIVEYPIKTLRDIKIMKYIIEHTKFHFYEPIFKLAQKIIGDRGVVSTYFARSPYMRLIIEYMGFKNTILYLKRFPNEMDDFIKFIEDFDDKMFNTLCQSPIKILNFGENIDANLAPPKYFEKYLIPHYERRVKQLQRVGKFCHIHMDGSIKDLLPYLERLPFDGLEALTAKPQGDITLKELQESIGNKILLDGIPAILFLPQYSYKYVKDYTHNVLEMFSPNLILGISDELPPNSDFKKVEMVASIVKNFEP
ncbi:MAG: uroporphyrinogen decarboxylase family protein [Candidatus Thorarchaeota archaeon]